MKYVLLPVEPTEEILKAMQIRGLNVSADGYGCVGGLYPDAAKQVYASIIDLIVEPQDQPIAEVIATGGPHDREGRVLSELQAELPPVGTKLYAWPPRQRRASAMLPERKSTTALNYPASLLADGWNSCLDEIDKRGLLELSVTNIMLDVVPGEDGMGEEIYAKSVVDVEQALSKLGDEVERLENLIGDIQELRLKTEAELEEARAQLAERDALLKDVIAGMNGLLSIEEDGDILDYLGQRAAKLLGISHWQLASAEPSVPDEQDTGKFPVGTMARGQAQCAEFNKRWEEPSAPKCKYCGDTYKIMVGRSGDANDGNAPILEDCEDCEPPKEVSLWYIRVPDEPFPDPEDSPAEYHYVGSAYERDQLLKKPGATIVQEYFAK